jgi:hypothetical protein
LPLSWNEIRNRAITFAREWPDAARERAEAQTFWNEFFNVFGIRRRTVAAFEEPVRNLTGATDFIDLLWPGRLIAEHKSCGGDLSKARTQAIGYIQSLHNSDRAAEAPRYILVSDFARIALHDLEPEDGQPESTEFRLEALPEHVRRFAFIAGYETRRLDEEDPANFEATERLANLHDHLEDGGYTGHDLQRFMVRILFCLFAEDTGIFEPAAFTNFVTQRTREDGADTGAQLGRFFEVLNTPTDRRQRNLDEDLAALPYVNGELFAERLTFADFNTAMRTALIGCCNFRWEKISPAVFGSLFQNIMDDRERRQIGAHYTSERDILKLIRSLFLDDLRAEFDSIRRNLRALAAFQRRLGQLRLLDPACGCGNFLVVAYRELRRLELDVMQARFGDQPSEGDIRAEARLDVGQFYGIEIEEWPVRIAEVAMWLMDHQMNAELFQRFGQVKATTPLTRSPHIVQANALRLDWNEVLPAQECTHVLGNPPFVGKQFASESQKSDMELVFAGVRGAGILDYVTAWYIRSAQYLQGTAVRCAFVSTNSITQGEQVGVLWNELFRRGVKIHFGHRTFAWRSEARGSAHVHVVIIGFGVGPAAGKRLYEYGEETEAAAESRVGNISPYLVEGGDIVVLSRSRPLCDVPEIVFGSMPNDGGHLLLDDDERRELLARQPDARKFVRRFVGSHEFINGESRWCLWLVEAAPAELRGMPEIVQRIEQVRRHRAASPRDTTRKLARSPALFGEIRQPGGRYLLIPSVSSEHRPYIPMGFMSASVIASNLALLVPSAALYHFGVLSSAMHVAWVRQVCGRLKSDIRYSNRLVYNNFPWPPAPTTSRTATVERLAQRVLDMRIELGDGRAGFLPATASDATPSSLADLYDPLTMPAKLAKAHADLDRAVDRCYRPQPFTSERQRLEYLFNLYEQLIAPLTAPTRPRKARRR